MVLIVLLTTGAASAQSLRPAEPVDTLRVDTNLVDLKVSVVSLASQETPKQLRQKDFLVFEDGAPQEISFFAAADTPFDLVLLIDLSGSAQKKLNLIRRSAKRFVEAARDMDRVAVVTFTHFPNVICELTSDRTKLVNAIDEIEKPTGGTNFWDALSFVLQNTLAAGDTLSRKAVVVMSDGVDNALPDVYGDGSKTSFEELLSTVGRSDVLVFPVYVDTEPEEAKRHRTPRSAYGIAREQLSQLARASGTIKYEAKELKDLDKVYDRVIQDLSTIYSIGYKPSNEAKDGKWRSVAVRLADRQDLTVRTKSGYFAKSETQSVNQ
jgi:Ca-activated chloride channel family protein